jgi:UDP-glucuronate 4-epimerase
MISGEKILMTGVSGTVGLPFAKFLARDNELWGASRFTRPEDRPAAFPSRSASREAIEALGIKTCAVDMATGDFSELPDDFTYVLHFAHTRRGPTEFQEAVQVNAIGAGRLLQHCRKAKAALVVSSTAVYSPPSDVFHPFTENDDIGRAWAPWAPTSPVSKVSLEAVARFCAEAFNLPVTIMRLNTIYGAFGGMPVGDLDSVVNGRPVATFADPYPHSPIHVDDACEQLDALLDAASTPANIVNWCGDEIVTQRQWCDYAASFAGTTAQLNVNGIPGTPNGNVSDNTKRKSITGPCRRPFKDAYRALYEELHVKPVA